MKTTITLKTSLSILFLFSSILLFGQKRYSLSLETNIGLSGIEGKEKLIDFANQRESYISPGLHYSFGVCNNFELKKGNFVSLSLGVLYSYTSFTEVENSHYTISSSVTGTPEKIEKTNQLLSQELFIPLQLHFQKKKIGFSFGGVYTFFLKSKLNHHRVYTQLLSPNISDEWEMKIISGERFRDLNREYNIEYERKRKFQYTFGISYQLNNRLGIKTNFKSHIVPNYLVQTLIPNSVGSETFIPTRFRISSNSLTIGIGFRIF